jgi:hypothetical protein
VVTSGVGRSLYDFRAKLGGQPLSYDFSVITEKGCHDLLGLSLPVPSTTSWRAEIDGKRFSPMCENYMKHAKLQGLVTP